MIDSSWGKYAIDELPDAEEMQFGDTFKQCKKVENVTAPAKAVSVTKKRQKDISFEEYEERWSVF